MKFLLFLLAFITCLSSCSVDRQAAKKVTWLLGHEKLAEACATHYPVKDTGTIVRDTVWRDTTISEQIIIYDTIPCDKIDSIVYRTVKCPPTKIITEFRVRDSIIIKRDIAAEEALKARARQLENTIRDKDTIITKQQTNLDKDNWWKIACIITWSLIAIYIILKIKKV